MLAMRGGRGFGSFGACLLLLTLVCAQDQYQQQNSSPPPAFPPPSPPSPPPPFPSPPPPYSQSPPYDQWTSPTTSPYDQWNSPTYPSPPFFQNQEPAYSPSYNNPSPSDSWTPSPAATTTPGGDSSPPQQDPQPQPQQPQQQQEPPQGQAQRHQDQQEAPPVAQPGAAQQQQQDGSIAVPAPAQASQQKKKSGGGSGAAIGGAVAGVLVGVAVIGALLYFLVYKKRKTGRLSFLQEVMVVDTPPSQPKAGATATAALATATAKVAGGGSPQQAKGASGSPPRQLVKANSWGNLPQLPLLANAALTSAHAHCTPVEATAALMQLRGGATLLLTNIERSSPDALKKVVGSCKTVGAEVLEGRVFSRQAALHRLWSWLQVHLWAPEGPCWQEPLLPSLPQPLTGSKAIHEAQQMFLDFHFRLAGGKLDTAIDANAEKVAKWMAADLGLEAQGAPWLRDATSLVRQAVACRLTVGAVHPCLTMRVSNPLAPSGGTVMPLDAAMPFFKPSRHAAGKEYVAALELNMDADSAAVLLCMLPGVGFEGEAAALKKMGITSEMLATLQTLEEVAVVVVAPLVQV